MTAPKLRFKEFDGDWRINTFSSISKHISYGLTVRPDFVESGIPLVSAREIAKGLVNINKAPKISNNDFLKLSNKAKPRRNDLFLSKTGSIGFTAIVETDETFAITQNIAIIRLDNLVLNNPIFFLHQMRTEKFQQSAIMRVNQSTIMDLQLGDIKKLELGIPQKEEQTKIASFLSAVDEKISQLTQKHALLSQYKQGMMQKLFGQQIRFKADDGSEFGAWEEKKLGDVCSRNYQGINTVADKVEYQKVGYPILQAKHITSEKLDFYDARFLSELDFEKYKDKYIPNPNDILFSNIGTIGKVVLVDESKPFFIAWNIFLISVKMNLTVPLYLALYLRWLTSLNYFDNLQTGNATKFINKTDLLDTKVNLPCLEEQTKNANFLSAIDQKIAVVAQKIE